MYVYTGEWYLLQFHIFQKIFSVLFLLGLMFVRLSSVVMTAWDPFSLIATYATKRNITGSSLEELNYTYFHIMCSFYSAIFAICYLGLTLPSARKIKNFQGTIDCSFTFVVLFGLQMSFVFARYSILMVLVGSLVGAFWSILLVGRLNLFSIRKFILLLMIG